MALKFYTIVEKGLKLKVRKFWGLNFTFVEVARGKLVEEAFLLSSPCPTPSYLIVLRKVLNAI